MLFIVMNALLMLMIFTELNDLRYVSLLCCSCRKLEKKNFVAMRCPI